MLLVARAASDREGLDIEWREGRAEELPFPDNSFDLVMCQFGLMFFSDRHAAVGEMHRVLVRGGRAVISVFSRIERHPFYQVLDAAIQKRLGASGVRDIFALGDENALRKMVTDTGFQRVEIESDSMIARFSEPEEFLAAEIDLDTAAIPAMQHLDANARQDLTNSLREDMEGPLRQVTKHNHVEIPFHILRVRAVS
jgi:SAM-dependent methyltransferase